MPVALTSTRSNRDIRLHVLARCPNCGSGKVDFSYTGIDMLRTSGRDERANYVGCADCGWVGEELKALPVL